jgi:hypothetical protein
VRNNNFKRISSQGKKGGRRTKRRLSPLTVVQERMAIQPPSEFLSKKPYEADDYCRKIL